MRSSLAILKLPRATYFRWAAQDGRASRPEAVVPKSHWLLPEERETIIAYKRAHPEIGYRRLCFMMLDEGVVAVAPSSVHRVLQAAGLSSRWTPGPGESARRGFEQPLRPHEQWHTDIAYLNILGTHYFFMGVLDGYSRSIVHHEVRTDMTTGDVEIVVERVLETLPPEQRPPYQPAPRLITDNGSQYMSADFRAYLRERDISHSRARVRHPQSNGKMELFHKSLKREYVRVEPMSCLEDARALIAKDVHEYNTQRLHSALQYLTPADCLQGPEHICQRLAERKARLQVAAERRKQYWQEARATTELAIEIPEDQKLPVMCENVPNG